MLSCAEGNVCAMRMASHGRLFGKDKEDPWVGPGFLSEACLQCDAVPPSAQSSSSQRRAMAMGS